MAGGKKLFSNIEACYKKDVRSSGLGDSDISFFVVFIV